MIIASPIQFFHIKSLFNWIQLKESIFPVTCSKNGRESNILYETISYLKFNPKWYLCRQNIIFEFNIVYCRTYSTNIGYSIWIWCGVVHYYLFESCILRFRSKFFFNVFIDSKRNWLFPFVECLNGENWLSFIILTLSIYVMSFTIKYFAIFDCYKLANAHVAKFICVLRKLFEI